MRNLLVLIALFSLVGCMHNPTLQPGALNAFDQQTYRELGTVQAILEETTKIVRASYPQFKPELDKVIDAYNLAQAAYKAYHKAALAGQPADTVALDAMVKQLKTDAAAITAKLKPQSHNWRVHEYHSYA